MRSLLRDLHVPRPVLLGSGLFVIAALGLGLGWSKLPRRLHAPTERLIPTEAPVAPFVHTPRERICTPEAPPTGAAATKKRYDLELSEVSVPAGGSGPYVRDWSYRGRPRDVSALAQFKDELTRCYRWARQRDPELEEPIKGRLLVNDWGQVATVSFSASPRAAAAASCFEGILIGRALSNANLPTSSLRWSEVPITLQLKRSGLRRPHDVARSPSGAAPVSPPGVCVIRPQPMDQDTLPEMQLSVDDFDEVQSFEEQEEDCRHAQQRWNESGRLGQRPECHARRLHSPEIVPGTAFTFGPVLKQLAQRLKYNLGAYRDCYVAEAKQDDDWRSARRFTLSFDSTGFVHKVTVSKMAPDSLSACLEKALAEVWVDGPILDFDARVSLRLATPALQVLTGSPPQQVPSRASVSEVERLAETALAEGDAERAERRFTSLLREELEHSSRCQWHVGILAAAALRAPWGDERFMAALAALGQYVRLHPDVPGLPACLGRAAPIITSFLPEEGALELQERAIALLPGLPNRRELRLRLAGFLEANLIDFATGQPRPNSERDACQAAEIYMQLAKEECGNGATRCWPARFAVRAFESCSSSERSFTRCNYPRSVTPVPEQTQRLYRARRFLLAHSSGESKDFRVRILSRWAWEYAYQWGQLDEATRLLHELIAQDPKPGDLTDAQEELKGIAAEKTVPPPRRYPCY